MEGGGLILSGTLRGHIESVTVTVCHPGCIVCSFTTPLPGFLEQTLFSYVNSAMTSGVVESLRWD